MKAVNTRDPYERIRLKNQLCFPLYACAKEVVRRYRKPLEPLGLTYTQYIVMMVLWEFGSMTEGDLGKRVRLDSGTLAPLLKRLEKQGLITRTRLETNERKLYLELTETGKALRDSAVAVPEEMDGCLPLSEPKRMQLKALLDEALFNMEKQDCSTEMDLCV